MKRMILLLLFVVANAIPATATVVMDSINAEFSPIGLRAASWEIGWLYRPQVSYTLTGVLTRFGLFSTADDSSFRVVTLEVYKGIPVNNGELLRTATFSLYVYDERNFKGGSFLPLELEAGEDYFIGFRNVQALCLNVTNKEGMSLTTYSDFVNDGTYSSRSTEYTIFTYPILQFEGVPEPATIVLLGLGGLLLRRRKR